MSKKDVKMEYYLEMGNDLRMGEDNPMMKTHGIGEGGHKEREEEEKDGVVWRRGDKEKWVGGVKLKKNPNTPNIVVLLSEHCGHG